MDKALEAVRDWLIAIDGPDYISQEHYEQQAREVIAIYLSALPATDTSGLVERLRLIGYEATEEAADRIEALERRLAEAEAVIQDIAEQPEEYHSKDRSYGVGWAFWHVQNIARSYLEGRK